MTPPTLTSAERLRALEATYGGHFDKTPQADGSVIVRLHQPTGEVIAAQGATTADAVAALEARVVAFHAALTGGSV